MINKLANKWNVLESISKTFLSEVLKVEDFNRNIFAAKVIQRDSNSRYGIYEKEVELLKKFQHDNIVKIVDHGEDTENEAFFIITEFIDGKTADGYFSDGINDEDDFIGFADIALQILSALSYIHKGGHLHRDIKPSNIMIDQADKPYLLDFGISQILDTITATDTKDFLSTVYAAPEQLQGGKLSEATDIHQLGITFLQLFADEDDFETFKNKKSSLTELIESIQLPYNLSDLESPFKSVIQKMTDNNPGSRFESCKELEIELKKLRRRLGRNDVFQICIMQKISDQIKDQIPKVDDDFEVKQYIENSLNGDSIYVKFEPDRSGRDQFIFVSSDFTLKTNVSQDNSHFFAFAFLSDPFESVKRDGVLLNDSFFISIKRPERGNFSNAEELKAKLISEENRRKKKFEDERTDKNFLEKSETLLKEERNQLEKLKFSLRYERYKINRGGKKIIFFIDLADSKIIHNELISKKLDGFVNILKKHKFFDSATEKDIVKVLNRLVQDERFYLSHRKIVDKNVKDKNLLHQLRGYHKKQKNEKVKLNYKILFAIFPEYLKENKQDIQLPKKLGLECGIYKNKKDEVPVLNGEISNIDKVNFRISVKYSQFRNENKIPKEGYLRDYFIVKDIILNRQHNALNTMKNGNTIIENLLSKISRVKLLGRKQELPEIPKWLNLQLDGNQQEAVRKIMALSNNEFLAIQGPPGTGKTTVITESILQILRREPRAKILVTSQSNQAVDNALERIKDDPEMRIARFVGKDKSKISEIASKYTYESVINMELRKIGERIEQTEKHFANMQFKELQQEWKKRVQGGDKELEQTILKNISVIFGTLVGIASWESFRNIEFDYVIVDEAGRATLPELAITLNRAKKFVLIGDHKQLPPVFEDEVINETQIKGYTKQDIRTTVFEELYEKLKEDRLEYSHFLNCNYRMHSTIANVISEMFYDKQIVTPPELDERKKHALSLTHHVYWYSTEKLKKRQDKKDGTSWRNKSNADVIRQKLLNFNNEYSKAGTHKTVGVISPYRSQSGQLKQLIKTKSEEWTNLEIDIATVDAFQGSDRDIIVFDTVRSNPSNRLGHITDVKRLNVALSRAKELLVIVGDADCAYKGKFDEERPNPYRKLIEIIRKRNNLYGFEKIGEK